MLTATKPNLKLIDEINERLAILNAAGWNAKDEDNQEWSLKELKYNSEEDGIFFKCE